MSEETLNNLFKQARNQAPETTINEINTWIGVGTSLSISALVLLKLKWFFTNKIGIMMTTFISATLTVATILTISNSEKKNTNYVSEPQLKTEKKMQQVEKEKQPTVKAFTQKTEVKTKEIQNEKEETNTDSKLELIPLLPIPTPANPQANLISSSPIVNSKNDKQAFTILKISGAAEVVLIQGKECNVRLEGDELGKSLASIEYSNGTLLISTKSNKGKTYKLTFFITVNDLEKLDVSGASEISTEGTLKQNNLTIKTSGASELNLNLESTSLDLITSGASEINLKGNCARFDLNASGASDLRALEYEVQKATIKCSGASELKLFVTDELNLDLSGASDIKCKGNPKIVKKSITGASEFKMI
ncbi:MAG: DUF2807 domain-containing protein [Flavobacteriales bacterium]|nr:DUF2807 domain-containing protein [Flavobacteriales bacterium]